MAEAGEEGGQSSEEEEEVNALEDMLKDKSLNSYS